MSDITMCTGNCPVKEYCLRYTAIPNPYGQSYSCLETVCLPEYSLLIPDERNIKKREESNSINYTLDDFLLAEIHKVTDCESN